MKQSILFMIAVLLSGCGDKEKPAEMSTSRAAEDDNLSRLQKAGEKSAEHVKQGIDALPAAHSPCSVSNSCELIASEIERECQSLNNEGPDCQPYKPTTGVIAVSGILVGGGGIDDMSLSIKAENGEIIEAYCDQQCGDWFDENEDAIVYLKRNLIGKNIFVEYAFEAGEGRVAGPSDDEQFNFIKNIKFR
jgi:hypothetical protein